MAVNKTVREVLKSTLLLKQKKFVPVSPWAIREVTLISENSNHNLPTQEKSMLQISNPKNNKVTTISVSNFVHIQPNVEGRTINIVLPDNSEIVFKAECHQLLVLWIATIKVAMSQGNLFHVKHRSKDGMVDEDALLQFTDVSTEGVKKPDQILMLSSPLDDITRHAWRVSQIRQFRITDLGISIEFCINCYRTYKPHPKSFNLFVHTSVLNACVKFICKSIPTVSKGEAFNSFVTIYKIQDHHCSLPAPPSRPPPPIPSLTDDRPPIPSRDHPRFGYLSGPPARPLPNNSGLVSPYKVTNKIVINNDGTISQESTVFGYRGSFSTIIPTQPPRKLHQAETNTFPQKKAVPNSKHGGTSVQLLPPKYIKRVLSHSKEGSDVDDQKGYTDDQPFDDYIVMYPYDLRKDQPPVVVRNLKLSDCKHAGTHTVNQVSVAPSDDFRSLSGDFADKSAAVDQDCINIQNILNELDKSVPIPKSQSVTKPTIKRRTLIKLEDDTSDAATVDHLCVIPRVNSLDLPASPKPIPRKRTVSSNASLIKKALDISAQLKENNKIVILDDENVGSGEFKMASQIDCEAKSRAFPKNVGAMKSCDINISTDDDDNVFTEDATAQGLPQGDEASVSADIYRNSPQPPSCGITSDQPTVQKQGAVTSADYGCSDPPAVDDVVQLDIAEHNGITVRCSSITNGGPEND